MSVTAWKNPTIQTPTKDNQKKKPSWAVNPQKKRRKKLEEAENNEKTNLSCVWFLLWREKKKNNNLQNGKVFLLQETEAETTRIEI